MSCIYKGEVRDTELSKNSRGGTEMMRDRLLQNANKDLLSKCAVHFSRPREIPSDVPNIFYCHDLAEDPENMVLHGGGWQKFDHIVFVSAWQRDQYISVYGIPYSHCSVIPNAIETKFQPRRKGEISTIKFIYHTTPHRGLELLVPIFEGLAQKYDNIELNVYSSFSVYGWDQRDEPYQPLFDRIRNHDKMHYHGAVSNDEVIDALEQSHIFLYPNIWKETSCIAMIEAIRSGLICIHPNYGALPETAGNATIMYDFHEDKNYHANFAYNVADQIIQAQNQDPGFIDKFTYSDRFAIGRHDIEPFTNSWNSVLSKTVEQWEQ